MMTAKDLKLDYFRFYAVTHQWIGQWVTLQGQFDEQPESVRAVWLGYFGNSASKNGESLFNKFAHLTWLSVFDPAPEPYRQVVVENQFGQQTLIIGATVGLLAPAQIIGAGAFPGKLDH